MPPPDTLIVIYNGDTVNVPDTVFQTRSNGMVFSRPVKSDPGFNPGLNIFFYAFLVFILIQVIRRSSALIFGLNIKRKNDPAIKKIINSNGILYQEWLTRYNPYYASLSKELQEVFLQRTVTFMRSKQFYYHSLQEEEYMPVLISGAAVQLTFGLRNYLMDYFSDIHVIQKQYHIPQDDDVYFGHVSKKGIHIAWDHFLDGYNDYTDSVNVGLHEMAHAISYDVFLGDEDHNDRLFKQRLDEFTEEGQPVFRAMRSGDSHVLDDYACTNFDEFWAVSIETFFENPVDFKEKMPALYKEISELLNQDPMVTGKIIDRSLV